MNKYIQLVKRWLEDPSSVTTEELKANADAASYTGWTSEATATDYAAYSAASHATYGNDEVAKYYVKKYEELLNENL